MNHATEQPATIIQSSAQFTRYLRRIVELTDSTMQTTQVCFVSTAPRSLNDPAQGFILKPSSSQADDETPETLLTNAQINSGTFSLRLLDRKEASTVQLARKERNPFSRQLDDVAALTAAINSYGGQGNLIATILGLHDDDPGLNIAWITCALAIKLDDELARKVLALVTPEEDDLSRIIYRVRDHMPGMWEDHDGTWQVTSEVSRELVTYAYKLLPSETIIDARRLIAEHWDRKAEEFNQVEPRGQLEIYRARRARHEAAYQRVLIPAEHERGVNDLHALWERQTGSAKTAIAESVAYLAPEIKEITGYIPEPLQEIIASIPGKKKKNQSK